MADEKETDAAKRIVIAKIYIKDMSFESPQTPAVFRGGDWKPQTNLNLRSSHSVVDGNLHEVVLTITVEAKAEDQTLFLVELSQAGLFEVGGYEDDEFGAIVGSLCPNILFPFAREAIAAAVQKGGFPEFVLQPINFDAVYAQSRQQAAQDGNLESPETH